MSAPPPQHGRARDDGDHWPPELAILAGQGFAPDLLRRAALLAERWGVTGDEALIASGLAQADMVYRALAAAMRMPYLAEPFAVHPLARFPEAVLGGIVPLAEGQPATFAYAPRGTAFAAFARAAPGRLAGLAICTPERLRTALFQARSVAIARSAAESLPRLRPDESFYDGVTPIQLVWMTGGAIAISFAAFAVGGGLRQALAMLMSLPFLGLTAIKLAAALERVQPPDSRIPGRISDRDLPVYTLLVPLFRESRVLARLVGALATLDYPALWSKCTKGC
ncbi:hypothetical protein [uncultured Enterovirga sp.]|uniref:hypothetical protein n=1 Tax=uncultured Enterovirga sp. TaxID=2026352 RepID=UPI0035CBE06E